MRDENELNSKEVAFIDNYLQCLNKRQSAIAAGYAPGSAASTATGIFYRPRVQAEIKRRMLALEIDTQVKVAEIINRLHAIANFDIRNVAEWDKWGLTKYISSDKLDAETAMCIDGIDSESTTIKNRHGVLQEHKKIKIKTADRLKAIELLGRYYKLWADSQNSETLKKIADDIARQHAELAEREMRLNRDEADKLADIENDLRNGGKL